MAAEWRLQQEHPGEQRRGLQRWLRSYEHLLQNEAAGVSVPSLREQAGCLQTSALTGTESSESETSWLITYCQRGQDQGKTLF